jgi:integrase
MSRSGFRTQREAQAALRKLQTALAAGHDPFPADMTVADWFTRWFASSAVTKLRPATVRGYREHADNYILPTIGSLQMTEVRRRHIVAVIDYAVANPKRGKELTPSSIRAVRGAMSSCFARAVDAEIIDNNPVTGVRLPKAERHELTIPDADGVRALMLAAVGTPWEVALLLSATTGARRSEVLGLRWSNVDLAAGRAMIVAGLQRVRHADGSHLELLGVKTDRSRRTITLPPFVVDRLRSWRKEQSERRLRLGAHWDGTWDLICDRGDGGPLDPDAYSHAVKRLLVVAKLPTETRLHDLRHAVATLLLEAGHDTAVASAVLGHSSPAFTAATYQHVRARLTDAGAKSIGDALG